MRIAFDATALPPVLGGAGNYIVQLLRALRSLETGDELYVFAKPGDVDRLGPWNGRTEPVLAQVRSRPLRLVWEQTVLPHALKRRRIDVLHSPHYTIPLVPMQTSRVVTFHDMIFFLYPEYHQRAKVHFFQRMIRTAARRADEIIADSDSTSRDTQRLLGVPAERLTTVPLAVAARFRPVTDPAVQQAVRQRYDLRRPFLLTVGTLEPRKNVAAALKVLSVVRAQGIDCELAIAGMKGWGYGGLLDEVSRQNVAGDTIRLLGFVPEDDLPALYSSAAVFLYLSLYEGFGIPVLEAMACGAPVIASNRSSMPEVVGNGGLLVDPEDVGATAAEASRLLTDEEASKAWSTRALSRAAQFSWERSARLTYAVYERAAQRARSRAH